MNRRPYFQLALFVGYLFWISPLQAESKDNAPVGLFFKIDPEALMNTPAFQKVYLTHACQDSARSCREAHANLDSEERKTKATEVAQRLFRKNADELSPPQIKLFIDESDLKDQLERSKSNKPIFVYKHKESPIYFIEFSSPDLQEAALARIGIFAEETGKIASGQFPNSSAAGHDYRLSDFAKFFNEVERTQTRLNAIETRLLNSFLQSGLLEKYRDEGTKKYSYIASKTSAIISAGSKDRPAISHELNHAVYFIDSNYRNQIARLYENGLTVEEKKLTDKIMTDLQFRYESSGALIGLEATNKKTFDLKLDTELFLTEFAASFRDPEELWDSHLKGMKYPEKTKIEIQSIARKVKGLDSAAAFYRPQTSPTSQSTTVAH